MAGAVVTLPLQLRRRLAGLESAPALRPSPPTGWEWTSWSTDDELDEMERIARGAAARSGGFTDDEAARIEAVAARAWRRMVAGEPKDHVVRARAAKERAAADEQQRALDRRGWQWPPA